VQLEVPFLPGETVHIGFDECVHDTATIHNRIRNTLHGIISLLAPLAGITQSKDDVQLETPNLLPQYPFRRPADLSLRLTTPTQANAAIIAVDFT
jgi:hypothetical protein